MKRVLLLMILIFSLVKADSVLMVKKGWQLIGSSVPITDMSKFVLDNVEEVWYFDAELQQWRGYSPDSQLQAQMKEKNVLPLTLLKNWHGFWVKSKEEWALRLGENTISSVPEQDNGSQDIIQLKKGWNLVSLPVDTVVSPNIFDEMTVWKYTNNNEWELFDQSEVETAFDSLEHIKNSDGIWVKAPKDVNISVMNEASKLHNFKTITEMENYIKEMIVLKNRPYWGIEPLMFEQNTMLTMDTIEVSDTASVDSAMPITSEGSAVKDATGTNLQEEGVDEADIVKHDGVNIFYTTRNSATQNSINITTFERLVCGETKAKETIQFNNQQFIDSLYLVDHKLVVLSNIYKRNQAEITPISSSEVSLPSFGYGMAQVMVEVFDVRDIANITKVSSYTIDGNMISSRVVNNKLYLVSRFSPRVSIEYPKIELTLSEKCQAYFDNDITISTASNESSLYRDYAECYNIMSDNGKNYYRYDYENPKISIEDLTPEIEDKEKKRMALIRPERLYASSKKNQSTNITSISEIDLSDGKYKQSNSFIGDSHTQYASTNAFYLVSTQYPYYYDFNNYKEHSTLYKFSFDDALNYKGIGSVYGRPLNQFALSEHQEIIRIATTEGFSWSSEGTNNSIYTLKQQDQALTIEGVLSGLGKERETIHAVRFMGDKAYVVTFEETDPLYTLDLSNPKAPQKIGELQVNGYSSYLHPVGDDKLLGIGRDATSEGEILGLKLELFDISDFANPTSVDYISYSDNTYSELESNHKALAYRNSDNLFAFPYQDYSNYPSKIYLGLYQIKGNNLVSYAPILSKSSESWWGQHRGIIFDHNGTSYASFFAGDTVQTEKLNLND
jgi:uncharacterized secreted protein with C-terminal beta-propeller domain